MLRIMESINTKHLEVIYSHLKDQPWCKELIYEDFLKACKNSYCLTATVKSKPVCFVRCITDYSQFGYITDVITLPEYQSRGYCTAMLSHLFTWSKVARVKEFFLIADPLGIYEKFDFKQFRHSGLFYSRSPKNSGIYNKTPEEYYGL